MLPRNKGFLKLSFLFVLILCNANSTAQQYSFINYSIEDGLAQSQVQTIFQDYKGYLWLGTYGGLTRYDGKSFVNYSKENGLLDNRINCIIETAQKEMYVATQGGINKFVPVASSSTNNNLFNGIPLKAALSKNQVTAMATDREGNVWIGTDGGGAARYNPRSSPKNGEGQFAYYDEKNGLVNNYVRSVCTDKNGNVWFGTRGGICFFDGKEFKRIDTSILQPHNISQIVNDRSGNLWFCTYGEGVFKYNFNTFINYTESDGLILDWIRWGIQDKSGNFWFASKNGVSKFDGKRFINFDEKNGLFYPNTNTLFQDNEGNIWFGTDGKGVLKFTGETFVSFTSQDGLSSDIIMTITEDPQHNLWMGTYGNGVNKQNNATKKFITYTTENGLPNNIVWTSLCDNRNNIWFGTSDGVAVYDGKRFTTIKDSLPARTVYSIYQDKKGNMWFGTTAGISVFDGSTYKNFVPGINGIGKNIKGILEDAQHTMWFAGSDGIFSYDGNKFTNYTTENGLSDNNAVCIIQDRMNNLWIGTSNGITFYNGKTFTRISIADKYNSNYVNFMLLDSAQRLWVGTNNGIYEMNVPEFYKGKKAEFRHYTNFEGLRSLECNQNAAFEDHSANLWFGTSGGVLNYSSEPVRQNEALSAPLIHITGIKLFLQPTDWSKLSVSEDPGTGLPKDLSVDHKKKNLTFDYIGTSLSNPGAVRYKFMLEGFDQEWSPPTDATFATYSNLPHGKYTFKVIACNKYNVWNKTPAVFSFEIRPPFWLTWWFALVCIVFAIALTWFVYHKRAAAIRRKQHTQQLEYKSKLLVLEHQTLNASMNKHFVFNALNSIQYYITKEDKTTANKYLSSFAKLIRKNLDSSLSNFVPLSEEIERVKLYLELEHLRLENKFNYRIEIDEHIDIDSIEIPPMMLQPYIENSIWHGILPMQKTGTIVISVKEVNDDIIFCIEDNGIGVEASREKKRQSGQRHISRGMEITSGRINLLKTMTNADMAVKGPFDIKNDKNETIGTRVQIVLPIKNHS